MEGEGDLEKIWWMPLCWAMKLTREYADVFMTSEDCWLHWFIFSAKNKQKIIPSDHKEIIRAISRFKDALENAVEDYDFLPLPPLYWQVLSNQILISAQNNWFFSAGECYHLRLLHPGPGRLPRPGGWWRACGCLFSFFPCSAIYPLHRASEGENCVKSATTARGWLPPQVFWKLSVRDVMMFWLELQMINRRNCTITKKAPTRALIVS